MTKAKKVDEATEVSQDISVWSSVVTGYLPQGRPDVYVNIYENLKVFELFFLTNIFFGKQFSNTAKLLCYDAPR